MGRPLGVGDEIEIELRVPQAVHEAEDLLRLIVAWYPERGEGGEQREASNLRVRHI